MSKIATEIPLQDMLLFRQACYIDDAWVKASTGDQINVDDPATGEINGTVPRLGIDQVRQAINAPLCPDAGSIYWWRTGKTLRAW